MVFFRGREEGDRFRTMETQFWLLTTAFSIFFFSIPKWSEFLQQNIWATFWASLSNKPLSGLNQILMSAWWQRKCGFIISDTLGTKESSWLCSWVRTQLVFRMQRAASRSFFWSEYEWMMFRLDRGCVWRRTSVCRKWKNAKSKDYACDYFQIKESLKTDSERVRWCDLIRGFDVVSIQVQFRPWIHLKVDPHTSNPAAPSAI